MVYISHTAYKKASFNLDIIHYILIRWRNAKMIKNIVWTNNVPAPWNACAALPFNVLNQ